MRVSRQNAILEIIKKQDVTTQDQLQALLLEEGYNVTQATISRDIKELQLIKGQSKSGKNKYIASSYDNRPISERFIKIFRETTLSYTPAQNIIVVKTLSGCGSAAGEALDCLGLDHIVGSISGDNTMMIIVDHERNVPAIIDKFDKIMSKHE